MEKFKIKVKNLEYFIMKLENATVEEKIGMLTIAHTLKKTIEQVDERIKNENVPRETIEEPKLVDKLIEAEKNKDPETIDELAEQRKQPTYEELEAKKNEKVHTGIRK